MNDEGGLVICDWPAGTRKPKLPLPYAQETMNGFEYAAAIQMIQHGMIAEGMTAVAALRERYDGAKRNPWNEFECGSNYARSLASYALLNAFSGFSFDMTQRLLGFIPRWHGAGTFRCFWSLDAGWGEVLCTADHLEIIVKAGAVPLRRLRLPFQGAEVHHGEQMLAFSQAAQELLLAEECLLCAGESLCVSKKE